MNCCNDNGQCTQGFNCPARTQRYEEKEDKPPFGYCHDFLAMLAAWALGIALGVIVTIFYFIG